MTTPLTYHDKTPAEVCRYTLDWTPLLLGSTITSVAAAVGAGDVVITLPAASGFSGAEQFVWITGGTEGRQTLRLTAQLADGRRYDQDIRFRVNA